MAVTVGIAAIANRPKGIEYPMGSGDEVLLLLADKQLTYGEALKANAAVPKRRGVLDGSIGGPRGGWQMLFAGGTSEADDILGAFRRAVIEKGLTDPPPDVIAERLGRAVQDMRREAWNRDVLMPHGLFDPGLYLQRKDLDELPDTLLGEIGAAARDFDEKWGCDLLVCGFNDEARPVLFTVDARGGAEWHHMAGYASIGSGSSLALARLMRLQLEPTQPFSNVLYKVMDAKLNADVDPAVSEDFDAWVMLSGWKTPQPLDPNVLRSAQMSAKNHSTTVPWLPWASDADEYAGKLAKGQ